MTKIGIHAMRTLVTSAALAVTIAAAGTRQSQSSPPRNLAGQLNLMGFTLGKSKLADVESKLGEAAPRRSSNAQYASNQICYVSSIGDTTVTFESGPSGGWTYLDGFAVMAGNRAVQPRRRSCTRTAEVTNDVHTEAGLRLGLTRADVTRMLGNPRHVRGNRLIFQWLSKTPMTKEEIAAENFTSRYWDVLDTIEITFSNSKVIAFTVDHSVTD